MARGNAAASALLTIILGSPTQWRAAGDRILLRRETACVAAHHAPDLEGAAFYDWRLAPSTGTAE